MSYFIYILCGLTISTILFQGIIFIDKKGQVERETAQFQLEIARRREQTKREHACMVHKIALAKLDRVPEAEKIDCYPNPGTDEEVKAEMERIKKEGSFDD